ncbi:MAG TPA: tRNA (guanosine(46)-N7)-methyltransferase TrmB [Bacteroidia bacterium]|nr:tRNA (guanosine(46)-N7)-methyltransferase TrmB [Bacteroidia bacterium]
MTKRKLQRFAETETFQNVFHVCYEDSLKNFPLKGKWKTDFFKNNFPIVLELGCGKGEYSVGLAERFPEKNFIGLDIKGARIWRGAKTAVENKMTNVAFLRTRIDFITSCFEDGEISEIWITFPDPQPQESRERKRLTSDLFLNRYKKILKPEGIVHLKTDNFPFYEYTLEQAKKNNFSILNFSSDLYAEKNNFSMDEKSAEALTQIQTFYEKKFSDLGFKICYLSFKM